MQVREAHVTGITIPGVALNVVVRVNNPNSFDIMVRRVRAQVTIADRYMMGPMEHSPNVWLAAGQATDVSTPVIIPWVMVPGLLAETLGKEKIPYRVQGAADVTATRALGVQVNNEAIDESGVIPRQMILTAARMHYPAAR